MNALRSRATTMTCLRSSLAGTLAYMAPELLERGRSQDAISPLRRALTLRLANPGLREKLGDTRFALARALWADPQTRSEARELAIAAHADLVAGKNPEHDAADVEAWLAAHRR